MSQAQLKETARGLEFFIDEKHSLFLDFVRDKKYLRPHRGKNELIAKALGYSHGIRNVWDLTAGLLEDSWFLLSLGFHVQAYERNPILCQLIEDALKRIQRDLDEESNLARKNQLTHLQFFSCDALQVLQSLSDREGPEAIYLDPMFEYAKQRSALPRLEMQIFREIIGPDKDARELLQQSLRVAKKRVVVKRPKKEKPLLDGVKHRYEGSAVTYDLYVV